MLWHDNNQKKTVIWISHQFSLHILQFPIAQRNAFAIDLQREIKLNIVFCDFSRHMFGLVCGHFLWKNLPLNRRWNRFQLHQLFIFPNPMFVFFQMEIAFVNQYNRLVVDLKRVRVFVQETCKIFDEFPWNDKWIINTNESQFKVNWKYNLNQTNLTRKISYICRCLAAMAKETCYWCAFVGAVELQFASEISSCFLDVIAVILAWIQVHQTAFAHENGWVPIQKMFQTSISMGQ